MNSKYFIGLFLFFGLSTSCRYFKPVYTEEEVNHMIASDSIAAIYNKDVEVKITEIPDNTQNIEPQMVGNDRDEHGCMGSAGFVWSNVLHRCVRLFEEGVGFIPTGKLLQQDNSNENNALFLGYVIFQQADSLYAELFFPHLPTTIICHKTSSVSGEKVWISGDYRVHQISNSRYYITHFGETIYTKD